MPKEPLVQVSTDNLTQKFEQAQHFLEQARYKQAVRVLTQALEEGTPLIETLLLLAQRALVYHYWKKYPEALQDATQLLALINADTRRLQKLDVDWEKERQEDQGYLSFLSQVYLLRGLSHRACEYHTRAVEDLSVALWADPTFEAEARLQRACALIELGECLDKAVEDLNCALQLNQEWVIQHFKLGTYNQGAFMRDDNTVRFETHKGQLKKLPPKMVTFGLKTIPKERFGFHETVNELFG